MTSLASLFIAAAVPPELAMINRAMTGEMVFHRGPMELHTGSINGREVSTLVTGPGTVNTAGALGALFAVQPPDALIVTGCGGAFGGFGLSLGDVALATEEIHGQLGVEAEEGPGPPRVLPFLPNGCVLDQALMEKTFHILQERPRANCRVSRGAFLTVATVTSRPETAAQYRNRYEVIMENMEGFAAAVICRQYQVPMLELRAVSNMVSQTDRSTWNLELAFERAQEAVLSILDTI
ncbi:MAG: futalosine hydrolase [Deltaproteobacteria bacterium]|nr:MAG: futalosine hydrolase [Deltaproteobacteria bacterium]